MNLTRIEQILDTKETVYAENADGSGSSCGYEYSGVHEAMKEIAIEFYDWVAESDYCSDEPNVHYKWNDEFSGKITTSQLFDIFNNSEKK